MSKILGGQNISTNPAYMNTGINSRAQNKTTLGKPNDGYEEAVDNNVDAEHQDLSDYSKLVSLPRPLSIVDKAARRSRGTSRSANPYAVDAVDGTFESDDSPIEKSRGIVNDGYEENRDFDPKQAYDTLNSSLPRAEFRPGEIYQTITEARTSNPVRKLSRKLKQSFKGKKRRTADRQLNPYAVDAIEEGETRGISNFVYEDVNDDNNHPYADLSQSAQTKPDPPSVSYPRRKPNKLYESSDDKEEKTPNQICCCLRESQMIKLCLFVIIVLFLLCFFLLILLMTGTVKVETKTVEPQGNVSQQKSTSTADFQPIEERLTKLEENVTRQYELWLMLARRNLTGVIDKTFKQMVALNETFGLTGQ